jgi:hypothetical protein
MVMFEDEADSVGIERGEECLAFPGIGNDQRGARARRRKVQCLNGYYAQPDARENGNIEGSASTVVWIKL